MKLQTSQYISSIKFSGSPSTLSDIAKNVKLAKLRLLYSQLGVGLAGSFVCATIIYWSIPFSSISVLKDWYIGMAIITFIRLTLFIHYTIHSKKLPIYSTPHIYFFCFNGTL